ncbi:MAG: restriction endonuclease [Pyrinomonadaceae bacterium]
MNDGLAYERLVQRIFQAILTQKFVLNIDVRNNVRLTGIITNHQVDVFWEFEVGDINYKTVVEVKDWNQPVGQGELMKFKAILDDLPGQPRGILVSRSGFQAGARRFASSNGIVLYELRKPTERDLRGRVRAFDFTFVSYHPITSNIALVHDEKWRVSEAVKLGLREVPRLDLSLEPEEARLLDEFGDQIGTIKEITDSCYPEGLQELAPKRTRYEFSAPTFLDTGCSDFPRLKLTAVEATIAIESLTQEFGVDVNELVHCIFKDALTGDIRTVDHQFLNVTQVD